MTRALVALTVVLALVVACDAAAGPPTDQLRRSIELVLKILSDPGLKQEAKTAERRTMIRTVANEIFDFAEISQRSLARHWQGRTPAERDEFVGLFGDLLEHSYITKIEGYSGEKIQYAGEVADGDQAIVKTRIVTKQGTEIPVDYRMFLKGERWRAYDVNIEGVSLVANYRTQFNAIIGRTGYPDLLAKLKAKQDERPGPREAGRRGEVIAPTAARAPQTRESP
jgi:phospholipid transport system substrate-binding protein